jgi:hypothetical protein
MTKTSEKILQDIKEKNICPAPRWKFLAKNSVIWSMFIVSLFVGALAIAVILDLLVNHDWDIYIQLHKTFWQFILLSLPYLWIVILFLFFGAAYYDFMYTKRWYRHKVYVVVLISIASSVGVGTVFFYSGIGNKIDKIFDENVPFYGVISLDKRKLWCHPEEGLIGGEIMEVQMHDPEKFVVRDCHGNKWEIEKSKPPFPPFIMRVGERIKVIGREMEEQRFEADEIRRW